MLIQQLILASAREITLTKKAWALHWKQAGGYSDHLYSSDIRPINRSSLPFTIHTTEQLDNSSLYRKWSDEHVYYDLESADE